MAMMFRWEVKCVMVPSGRMLLLAGLSLPNLGR